MAVPHVAASANRSHGNHEYGQQEASGAASEMRDDLSLGPWGPRHLRGLFGGGAVERRPRALSPGVRFLRCVVLGTRGRRRNWQTWIGTHVISMGCSFIAMLTAFCVEEGESLPGLSGLPRITYWFLLALVGTPFIVRALVRHRLRYRRAAVKPRKLHISL